jgi:DNA repair protein RecN (Recombination protein N)
MLRPTSAAMLLELRVENYALIDQAAVSFGPGLNLLTGETGAGKSILIGALALLLGEKASSDVVRRGAERATVSCVFESTPAAQKILLTNGLDASSSEASGEIIVRREILANGKGRVFVDDQPATVTVLRQLAPELALIHAQSESLVDFDASQQRLLLDRFGGIPTEATVTAFNDWRDARAQLAELEQGAQDRLRMLDLWQFQRREIASANLKSGEDEELEAERRLLSNSEKILAAASAVFDLLYDAEASASGLLASAAHQAEELARYDTKWQEFVEQLAAARAAVNDVAETARDYAQNIQASPQRLADIEDRLALIDRLKRKYSDASREDLAPLDQVIAFGEEAGRRLAEVEDRETLLAQLRKRVFETAGEFKKTAEKLTASRATAARKLEKLASQHINQLAMKVRFAMTVVGEADESHWSTHGWDTVACLIATTTDGPLRPLREIASGGEMSRILLALKVSVEEGAAAKSRRTVTPRTLVFDEIDIGIGGRAAEAVGQKLKQLSAAQQVLCITHLPQIAAFADQHFVVEKSEHAGRTRTSIRRLTAEERVEEVARMLSGAKTTVASLQHAKEMIASSR